MATLQNIGKLKYRGKDGLWHPLPVVVQDAGGGVSTISGKGAPTSETQGEVNQLYRDEDTQRLYICTATEGGGYTWVAVSGGSVDVDATLTKAGRAADAKAAGDAIVKKIDKAQGTGNAGKILGIGADGNVTPQDKPVQALAGASAPNTATAGVVGQEYYVVVNNAVTEMYVCTAVANGTYTWGRVEFGAEIDDTSTEPTKVWSAEKCNQLSEEIVDCIKSPVSAAVGQTIKVSAVGENGKPTEWEAVDMPEQVQADWNQNDSTAADYVKNRTHWTEYGLDVAGFTITIPISSSETTHDEIPFEVGQVWNVVSNRNFSRILTVEKADDGTVYIGSYPTPSTINPFYVSTTKVMGESVWVNRDGNTSITLTCTSNRITHHTIPFEYFPDTIFSQENSPVKFGVNDSGEIIKTASVQGTNTVASKSNSHAEGASTKATGYRSHAEGYMAKASGDTSHAEGYNTKASGGTSHAEGRMTEASGSYSHSEGEGTTASGQKSHAEGWSTIASSNIQHVQGKLNVEDSSGVYAHIVGNGISAQARSNAHTLDWKGNAWFAGDVFIGGSSQDDGVKLLKTGEAIPVPQTASVGQVLVVKAVDENGKPTEWEAVDPMVVSSSTSGSAKKFKLTIDDNGTISATEVIS